jgi:predicted transposase/invertase (TIGR01784 family)
MNGNQNNGQTWENLTIANNFMFYKIMRNNPDVCKELLEILLEFKVERIEMSQEEEIKVDFDSKGIRLDVYAKDADGLKVYNIEMQASDTKELPERARYYQGVIDVDQLKSGEKYKALKTSFVIFICVDDIFESGLPKYTFENLCQENPKVKLNDRAYKYFFISKNYDKLLNEDQKAFLRMVTENKASNKFTGKMLELLNNAKRNAQWRKQFMDLEREKTYAFDRGMEQKAIETAKKLLADGKYTAEEISALLQIPVESFAQPAPAN